MKSNHIIATTCPYGSLEQHLNDTANCELGDGCVYSPKPFITQVQLNLEGSRRVLKAIEGDDEV